MNMLQSFLSSEQQQKIERFRILNQYARKGEILFTGSSLMEQFPVNEALMDAGMAKIVYNRGVGGFTTTDMLKNMEEQIFGIAPSKIFINIGTNDISDASRSFDEVLADMLANYEIILKQIRERLPQAEVYVMAYYPVNETVRREDEPKTEWSDKVYVNRNNQNLPVANAAVKRLAEKMGYHYIDANTGLFDEQGRLKKEFTVDGVHMYANGYQIVFENIKPYL